MEFYIYYLVTGLIAGVLAGLLGVGGGLVIVPVLTYIFLQQGFDATIVVHLALGTSLATIVFTSMSSVWAHHKHGAIQWHIFWRITPGILLGALLGAWIADQISTQGLRRFFAFFEWAVALQLLFGLVPGSARSLPVAPIIAAVGVVIGIVSALVGIGGGTLTVPFLVYCSVAIRQAVATSSACGMPIAIAGALGFFLVGKDTAQLPAQSWGYIYWPALLFISMASVSAAPLGAFLAHRLPAARLKQIFALVLIALGLYMFAVN